MHFDSFGHGILTVFEVSSGEMWPDIMYNTVDAVGIAEPMLPNYNQQVAWYYIFVQIVIAFLMLNVFVGVVIEEYEKNKQDSDGTGLLSDEQKAWVETMKLALTSKASRKLIPPKQCKGSRIGVFNMVTNPKFDIIIMACIVLNTILMAMRHYNQGLVMDSFLEVANIIFAVIFTIEMVLKWIGMVSSISRITGISSISFSLFYRG